MLLKEWDQLPLEMQTEAVRKYYDVLRSKQWSLICKRVFDVVVSLLLLIVLAPVFLILAIAIKLDSPGPVFYRQERVTQYGERFQIHKFRTMVQNAEEIGPQVTVGNDDRITRLGKMIRSCRIDETAQLLDVLSGKMTFCATRAEIPRYVEQYTPEMMATLLLPAGVTSLASILYKDEAELLDGVTDTDKVYVEQIVPAKMYYNLKEMEEFNFWNNIKVMVMTVLAVCGKEYRGDYVPTEQKKETKGQMYDGKNGIDYHTNL